MENKKIRVGILSDSPFICTGYSTISSHIGNILVDAGMEVFYFAHSYMGQNLIPPITVEGGRQLKFNIIGQGREAYFKDLLSQYLKDYQIDVLYILLDSFMLYPWFLNVDTSPAKVVIYYPSDGGGALPLNCEQILQKADLNVAMAKFGQLQVKKCHNIDSEYIPHAIDLKNYFKLPDKTREELKQKAGLAGRYVIGVMARNQGRKFLDRTLKIMAEYSKINPNAVMLMHLDPQDPAQPFPILSLIQRYGLENRIVFTGNKYYRGLPIEKMKEVYNVFDCFLHTSSGEGFGIGLIEAMACEVPVIGTDYTTTKELIIDNNAGLGIKLVETSEEENEWIHGKEIIDGTITGSWSVERGICSIKDGVKKLDWLYKHLEEAKQMGKNGRDAVLKDYNWDVIGPKWVNLVENLANKY